MDRINDGGPDTPTTSMAISLRDWFAGMAMQGTITFGIKPQTTKRDIALTAYSMADAMLKARGEE